MPITFPPRLICAMVLVLAAGACASDDESSGTPAEEFSAQVASYDLVAGRPQRVIVGLLAGEAGLVGFGSVRFAFRQEGAEGGQPAAPGGPVVEAGFRPIPGQTPPADTSGPRVVQPSEAIGVYAADGVRFDRPGKWRVDVQARVDGRDVATSAAFDVLASSEIPLPGTAAPRTENHLPGAPGVPPQAVDSRADASGSVPDPQLHSQTVAAAIATGRPTMIVISTPVYCQSRFCGPITDSVQRLAVQHGARMNFVHLEVWRNFQGQEINRAAAEWIFQTPTQDIHEPWVFVMAGDGTITERYDNVASDAELEGAVTRALA